MQKSLLNEDHLSCQDNLRLNFQFEYDVWSNLDVQFILYLTQRLTSKVNKTHERAHFFSPDEKNKDWLGANHGYHVKPNLI